MGLNLDSGFGPTIGLAENGALASEIRFLGSENVDRAVAMVPPDIPPLNEWIVVDLPGCIPFLKRAMAER